MPPESWETGGSRKGRSPLKLLTTPGSGTISLGAAGRTETGLNEHRKGQEERGKGGEMLNLLKQEGIDTAKW